MNINLQPPHVLAHMCTYTLCTLTGTVYIQKENSKHGGTKLLFLGRVILVRGAVLKKRTRWLCMRDGHLANLH